MPGSNHALLSPSASHIWIKCPPSARLSEGATDQTTDFARQGTCAHSLCQYKLEKALGYETEDPTNELEFHDSEMEECSEAYRDFVLETMESMKHNCPDPVILIEQKLDFSRWVPGGFGYGDCLLVGDGTMNVIDYKHGEGLLVEAKDNTQMMCYALGAVALLDGLYDIENIRMTIFQPRRSNVSTWSIDRKELLDWAEKVLVPAAELAFEGKGEFSAGDHCRFCRSRNKCRARAEYNLELARYDFAKPDTLDDLEIAAILERVDSLLSWASDIKDYALEQALAGKKYDGFKVVSGRSSRKYTDENAAAQAVQKAGFDPYEKSILGITAMSKLLGKKKFEEILGPLVYKAQGKPTLVAQSDARPAYNSATEDFKVTEE